MLAKLCLKSSTNSVAEFDVEFEVLPMKGDLIDVTESGTAKRWKIVDVLYAVAIKPRVKPSKVTLKVTCDPATERRRRQRVTDQQLARR